MTQHHLFAIAISITSSACSMLSAPEEPIALPPIVKQLWPANTKNREKRNSEKVMTNRRDNVRRITDITNPSFTVYQVDKNDEPTPAVLIFPGGGYSILAINKEGTEIAEWLNNIGITAIVVKYRVPRKRNEAFQDAQRAIRLVRHHAKEWNIDPKRTGIIGFSAGGHLSARLSTDFENRGYTSLDDADEQNCRPDFCILVYPAYLIKKKTQELVDELPVTRHTPPTLIIHTEDDRRFVIGSKVYNQALKKAGVSSEFQLFQDGGHGYGLRPSKHRVSKWPKLCEEWLKANGVIKEISNKPDAGDGS